MSDPKYPVKRPPEKQANGHLLKFLSPTNNLSDNRRLIPRLKTRLLSNRRHRSPCGEMNHDR